MEELREHDVPSQLAKLGLNLQQGYQKIAAETGLDGYTACKGHPSRTIVTFNHPEHDPLIMKSLVQQEMIRRGVLWSGFHNLSYSHTKDDIHYMLGAYREVLGGLKEALDQDKLLDRLVGEPVQPVFRKVGDFNTKPKPIVQVPTSLEVSSETARASIENLAGGMES
jgi:hypothetical protein